MDKPKQPRFPLVLAWLCWVHALALLAPLIATDRPLLFHGRDETRALVALDSLRALERAGDAAGMEASLGILARESAAGEDWQRATQLSGPERMAAVSALIGNAQPGQLPENWQARVRWRSPAVEVLGNAERALLLFVPLLIVLPWLRWRMRSHAVLLITLVSAVLVFLPREPAAPAGEFKQALADGRVQAEFLAWAPIPYSPSELKPAEAWLGVGSARTEPASPVADGLEFGGAELLPLAAAVHALPGEPKPGSWRRHLLGTDGLGRDSAARVLHGARTSIVIGLLAALLASAIGAMLGAFAGLVGGFADAAILRVIEVLACMPGLLVVLLVMSLVPAGGTGSMLALLFVLVLFGWAQPARMVRAQALRVRELDFVRVAQGLGKSRGWILREHILPNTIDSALVGVGFLAVSSILLESTVSFLGVGIAEPTPSLGALVASAIGHGDAVLITGLALVLLVLPWHLLTEQLRARLQRGEPAA